MPDIDVGKHSLCETEFAGNDCMLSFYQYDMHGRHLVHRCMAKILHAVIGNRSDEQIGWIVELPFVGAQYASFNDVTIG